MKWNSLRTYTAALLGATVLVTVFITAVVIQSIEDAADDADTINAAGRQRTLSQMMAKSVLGYDAARASLENTKSNVADMDTLITQMRGTYTQAVIGPAKEAGLAISMHPDQEPHAAVPYPATFARMVNEKFGARGGLDVEIIAEQPINPQQTLKDTTDREAYRFLKNNPKEIFFRDVEQNGALYLRFYTADTAVVQGCADCHTRMTGKPYKMGDMLGIRRFSLRYSSDITAGRERINPSLAEYQRAADIFSRTLTALKSGGDYPADMAMSQTRHFDGSPDPAFQAKITEIEQRFADFQASVERLDKSPVGSQSHWDTQQAIINGADELQALSNDLTNMYAALANAKQKRVEWAVVILAIVVIAVFGLIYLLLSRAVINPVRDIATALNRMAEGDLTYKLESRRKDEIGELIQMVNITMNDVGNSIVEINTSSEVLKDVSREMSEASHNTGEAVKQQLDEIQQAATAVTQMSATVHEMAQNTALAAQSTEQAREAATNGQRVVSETITSINALAGEVKEAAEVIRRVEEDSSNINAILDTIRSIAEQTNLLALNAAIEAARAGEHGRGFSVVADEVRSLASRTQDATGEIQGMIETLQQRTEAAVDTMNRGTQTAETSVTQAANANEALSTIVAGVGEISEMNLQIATAAEELANVTSEIDANIVAVNDVSQQTAEVADSSYESSHRVAMVAAEISSLMHRFKIDAEAAAHGRHQLFTWSEALDVGVEEVNRQHKMLIGLINELFDLIESGRSGAVIRRVLQGLVDYTVNHFGYEEHLLEKYGYPDVEGHKKSHEALIAKVSNFVQRVDAGEDVSHELLAFLEEWLKKHIQGADKDYASFLNDKGLH